MSDKEKIARSYIWLSHRAERVFGCSKEKGDAARAAAYERLNEVLKSEASA